MTDMNAMLDKVKKLLALAGNNPSEEEAKSALMKANALIAKYNLDLSADTDVKVEYSVVGAVHSNNEGYRTQLAQVIAVSFRCQCIILCNKVHFFGRKQDAQACAEVFNYAYRVSHNIGLRLERQARKEGKNTHGVANSYWRGFVQGLNKQLGEQCKALAVVVPQDVKDEFSKKYPNTTRYNGGMRHTGLDADAYFKGVDDGRSFMDRRSLQQG